MSRRQKALKDWVLAGLIAEDQARAIENYETARRKGRFGRGLVGLSLFAILVGVLSIIASNWHQIPGEVKIGVHVLLNLCVGAFAWHAAKAGKDLQREGAVFAFLGLTLTLIILIGQVYQLGGQPSDAFMFWLVIALPFFLLLGNGYLSAVPWMIGFVVTVGFALAEKLGALPQHDQFLIGYGTAILLPLCMMADGKILLFQKMRPALADISFKTGAVLLVLWSSISLLLWRGADWGGARDVMLFSAQTTMIFAAGLAGLIAHAVFYKFYKNDERMKTGALFALVSLCACCLPPLFLGIGFSVLSAIAFIAYWMFIGWIGQRLVAPRLVSLAIAVIAIRIFFLYVELFGSLMSTGIGLIVGGVVMLGLIYGARKLNARITGKAGAA